MCRTTGLISVSLAFEAASLLTKLPHPVIPDVTTSIKLMQLTYMTYCFVSLSFSRSVSRNIVKNRKKDKQVYLIHVMRYNECTTWRLSLDIDMFLRDAAARP